MVGMKWNNPSGEGGEKWGFNLVQNSLSGTELGIGVKGRLS